MICGDSFPRLGFYYTHYQCLGHTARVFALIKAVKGKFSGLKTYLIRGSAAQPPLVPPKFAEVFDLPKPLFSRENFKRPLNAENSFSELRASCLLELIKKNGLDIFMTEYFPLGRNPCKNELLPALYFLKKRSKFIAASAGYPVISRTSMADLEIFSKFYSKIYVHSPIIEKKYIGDSYKSRRERNLYLDLFKKYSDKIIFTGYVFTDQLDFSGSARSVFPRGKRNVLVTRGAGAYYPHIVTTAIKASDMFGDDFHFTIVSGPSTSKSEWREFGRLMGRKRVKNAVLKKYSSNLKELIEECDLCVSTASYNTSVHLLYYKKKSVVIPFEGYGSAYYREQPSRARLLNDFIGSGIITFSKLNAFELKKEILYQMNKNKTAADKVPKNWFKGSDNFSNDLSSIVGGEATC